MAFVIGLTGGIGSGKTTVANLFAHRGAGVVDTDEISHCLTGPGQPAVTEIARRFGSAYTTPDGGLDRRKMRDLVFDNVTARQELEAILHPLIRAEAARQVGASSAAYTLLVVPLLIETGATRKLMARVLVVDCEPEIQIRRVMERSGMPRSQVLAIIAAQVSRQRRLDQADDVILNNGTLEDLAPAIDTLHARYLDLARAG